MSTRIHRSISPRTHNNKKYKENSGLYAIISYIDLIISMKMNERYQETAKVRGELLLLCYKYVMNLIASNKFFSFSQNLQIYRNNIQTYIFFSYKKYNIRIIWHWCRMKIEITKLLLKNGCFSTFVYYERGNCANCSH